jgi:hypothetical protein
VTVSTDPSSPRPPTSLRELESLRIARKAEKRPNRLVPAAIGLVAIAVVAGIGYEV